MKWRWWLGRPPHHVSLTFVALLNMILLVNGVWIDEEKVTIATMQPVSQSTCFYHSFLYKPFPLFEVGE
jgi:hypothetical protein